MKKIYVLDTNVFLTDADSIYNFGNNDIIIPFKVLDEIDKHKNRQDSVGANARLSIRYLDEFRKRGSLLKGVRISKGMGLIYARGTKESLIHSDLDIKDPDNRIIATALSIIEEFPKRKIIIVTHDINMRIKCDIVSIQSEDYEKDSLISSPSEMYSGYTTYLVDDQIIDQFYNGEKIFLYKEDIKLYPNQFVMLVSNSNEKKSAIGRFIDYNIPLKKIDLYKFGVYGLIPKNKEQNFALDILLDSNISLVSIIGSSGGGKSLLSIAAGLELVLEQKKYKRMIIIRPMQSVGKEIGFLPGSVEDKTRPWLKPIEDNLINLISNRSNGYEILEDLKDKKIIEIECLSFIRGRSISNSYIVIDESQNLSGHELKTIITRAGQNSKIVINGDVRQIDVSYLNETTSGLTTTIEKLKAEAITAHITLKKSERSPLAAIADRLL